MSKIPLTLRRVNQVMHTGASLWLYLLIYGLSMDYENKFYGLLLWINALRFLQVD